ncbi:uncharacterized protein MELLADRAFT_94247 [Melampsora larici-populina 98AG31]|uniref:Uncharacterized protein n=1 Tax=Melampsora larici-populina (strain 98AG31 / pathotype 3-4-7) TaxID=747676 RepID=F4S711_MELLP|nr:uncharacterized protein MELLADRAFT_94247 [Melampsora larici-populina 98AG31]EGF99587.1 hypothetical protein MELLADRAFT_94247 [Melampsora larici-populina 98AG31]
MWPTAPPGLLFWEGASPNLAFEFTMNTETPYNFSGQFRGRGSLDLGEGLEMPSQGGSIQGFNNHGSLRNHSNSSLDSHRGRHEGGESSRNMNHKRTPNPHVEGRLEYPPRRERDDRSRSPSGQRFSTQAGAEPPSGGLAYQQDLRNFRDLDLPNPNRLADEVSDGPAMFSSPLPAPTMQTFHAMAMRCGLEGPFLAYAKDQAEVYGETNRHLGQVTANSKLLMELARVNAPPRGPSPETELGQAPASALAKPNSALKWRPSSKLLGLINPLALKLLFSPIIQSYTALESVSEGYLPDSLFNTIKKTVAKEGAVFAAEHLPRQICGVEEAPDAQTYASALKKAGKHAREKLHNVLLVGIHDSKTKERVDVAVPNIKGMVQRVAVRCGVAGEKVGVEVVWAATDRPTRARIAYLRREAARLVLKGGRGSESIWAVVDWKLSELRLKGNEDYTTAFYQIVYEEDREYFDGKVWFKHLQEREPKVTLDLPSDEAIMARIAGGGANPTPSGSNTSSIHNPAAN